MRHIAIAQSATGACSDRDKGGLDRNELNYRVSVGFVLMSARLSCLGERFSLRHVFLGHNARTLFSVRDQLICVMKIFNGVYLYERGTSAAVYNDININDQFIITNLLFSYKKKILILCNTTC